jgi:hypothetical protein
MGMPRPKPLILAVFAVYCALVPRHLAAAESAPAGEAASHPAPVELDVEIDPLAYVLSGYSVHAGVRYRRFRFDLGAFGLDVPTRLATNPALEERYDGFGVKVDYHVTTGRWVPFAGLSASRALLRLTEKDTQRAASTWQFVPAVRAGLEIAVVSGFYLSPWVSLGYTLSDGVELVGDETYERSPWRVFPTVHLGWRAPRSD